VRWLARVALVAALALVSPVVAVAAGRGRSASPSAASAPQEREPWSPAASSERPAPTLGPDARRVTLGRFVTTFAYDAEHRGRAFNVELAAQAVDGRVIRAGGTLSFNEAVGERTASFGFARSVVLRDGMLAEGAGGGACQVASTLHAAALLAGLDVVSRAPHSRPSAYIRMGFDATVALGPAPIDLRLKNPTAAPVVVHARAHRGALDVWLEGRGPAPEVRLTSEIVGRVGYPRTIARDPLVPEDVVKIRSFGIPGYRVRRVRELRLPDGTTRRDVREDVYPPVPQVVVVAPSLDAARLGRRGAPSQATEPDEPAGPELRTEVEPTAVRPVLVQLRPSTLVTLPSDPAPRR